MAQFILERGSNLNEGQLPSPRKIMAKEYKCTEIFKKSSPEQADQYQSNLVQIILGHREFQITQLKGQVLFKGEIITKKKKKGWVHLKILFSRTAWLEKCRFTQKLLELLKAQIYMKST
jgi:hypothetical protein